MQGLPVHVPVQEKKDHASAPSASRGVNGQRGHASRRRLTCLACALLVLYACIEFWPDMADSLLFEPIQTYFPDEKTLNLSKLRSCPQVEAYDLPTQALFSIPSADTLADRLSAAVQVDTSVGDQWPAPSPDKDDRWNAIFEPFRKHLEDTYPLLHAQDSPVTLEVVNQHGLIYTLEGTDDNLKPLMLTAHQDVVPVNPSTVDQWAHPPFSGFIDSDNSTVWGRGSMDAKAWLVALMNTVESILASPYRPKRGLILAFGFDEESSGVHGAGTLGKRLGEIYGKDSIAMIVDEGNGLIAKDQATGIPMAIPAVEEKGMMNVRLRVETAGGHSSAPPKHTSVGLLARLITRLEDRPPKPRLVSGYNAHLSMWHCLSNGPKMDARLRSSLRDLDWAERSSTSSSDILSSFLARLRGGGSENQRRRRIEHAKERVLAHLPPGEELPFLTTRAADIFNGGVKSNALPEEAIAIVNHRIATYSNVDELRREYVDELADLAREYGLEVHAWGSKVETHSHRHVPIVGTLTIDEFGPPLEPAPKTPLEGPDAKPWRLLSGIIRATWRVDDEGEPLLSGDSQAGHGIPVSASEMYGNTDTQHYWHLTKHIFRFGPTCLEQDKTGLPIGVHTVNEHYAICGLVKATEFYRGLIWAASDADL